MKTGFPWTHSIWDAPALWIHDQKDLPVEGIRVFFRNTFQVDSATNPFEILISASQRYALYLDGKLLSRGPARSDPMRWNAHSVLIDKLAPGFHVFSAEVTHFGKYAGIGQLGLRPFFLLLASNCSSHSDQSKSLAKSDTKKSISPARNPDSFYHLLNEPENWKAYEDKSLHFHRDLHWPGRKRYFAAAQSETFEATGYPWGWQTSEYIDTEWTIPITIVHRSSDRWGNIHLQHKLYPNPLPEMEEREVSFKNAYTLDPNQENAVLISEEMSEGKTVSYEFGESETLSASKTWDFQANSNYKLLLDRGEIDNCYPLLKFSGGKGCRIQLIWCEALADDLGVKGNRNNWQGKFSRGPFDVILPDGKEEHYWMPQWFRSFRFLEIQISTSDANLRLWMPKLYSTGFPLRRLTKVKSQGKQSLTELNNTKKEEISWRTIRLCAHETFFDCPHYEQAQFPGDTRIQALYHYLICNEDRLAKKAIADFHASRIPDGLTQCRYPSREIQILPTFSLLWIGMLHDFRVYRGDAVFLSRYIPFAREVMQWFTFRLRPDGMPGLIEHAPFIDWVKDWPQGNAPQDEQGCSTQIALLLCMAASWMAELERFCGESVLANKWKLLAKQLQRAVKLNCWSKENKLLADTAGMKSYSIHTQALAVLADIWAPGQAQKVMQRAFHNTSITQAGTLYFQFYIAQALRKCNLGNLWQERALLWDQCLQDSGLSTWPESLGNPRSDCHAWSVTPSLENIQTTLGLYPDATADGFSRAIFNPFLGELQNLKAEVHTPRGQIKIQIERIVSKNISKKGSKRSSSKQPEVNVTLDSPIEIFVPLLALKIKAGKRTFRIPA